jgi:para-aminobenzoate synthetase component 1
MTKGHAIDVRPLPGDPPPELLPEALFERPHFVLLESSLGGRYTIAAWEPREVLEARAGSDFLKEFGKRIEAAPRVDDSSLPFAGGWIGFLGYELYDEILPKVPSRPVTLLPKARIAFYESFYLYDHFKKQAFVVSPTGKGGPPPWPAELARRPAATCHDQPSGAQTRSSATPADPLSRSLYLGQVARVKELIASGDCYQVNLSQKFETPVSQPSFAVYRRLRETSPSPYASYLNLGDAQILSSSPELFLEIDGHRVITRPIKGTRPRGTDGPADALLKEELATSAKDRAELLMITDLERNDLGRVCRPGSVRVSELRTVESFPQVHHLVSTVEGEIAEGRGVVDVLKATFPGGSITGAPKIRAMQVIRELEPHAREVYCGAIGFVSLNGKAQFNVAIRTMVVKDGKAHFWSGGGIVADSDPHMEYEETLVKARGMMRALDVGAR